jgi:hypothetical protein
MSGPNPTAPRIGTADRLQPFKRVDSRTCTRCGARAGKCAHLANDSDVIWLSNYRSYNRDDYAKWEPREIEQALNLRAAGYGNKQIAEAMNKTEAAIAGVMFRHWGRG